VRYCQASAQYEEQVLLRCIFRTQTFCGSSMEGACKFKCGVRQMCAVCCAHVCFLVASYRTP
jgi:hypothetical protein